MNFNKWIAVCIGWLLGIALLYSYLSNLVQTNQTDGGAAGCVFAGVLFGSLFAAFYMIVRFMRK